MSKHSKSKQPKPRPPEEQSIPSRRNFLSGGMMLAGGAIVGSNLAVARNAHAFGTDVIKVGLVGCGRRGTSAAIEMLNTGSGPVQLVAIADVFQRNLHKAFRGIKGKHPDKVDVRDRRFVGLDSYAKVMQTDADLVILATPPGFRPQQFEAAVQTGKHVFMEKPVATDAPGVRRVLAAAQVALEQGLAVSVGLQRRHELRYVECVQQLRDGVIGDPVFARAYWNGGAKAMRPRRTDESELEYQLRNWCHFAWLGGDQISEQHIHNLDVINWLMGTNPIEAQGQGGRTNAESCTGQTFDHHMVEFTYPGGAKLLSQCRQQRGCWNGVGEHVHCTRGSADISKARIVDPQGKLIWQSSTVEPHGKGWQQQQHDLIAALRRGELPGEAEYGALSTMTAIMGRMATYSGKIITWDRAISDAGSLADSEGLHSLDDPAPVQPDRLGRYSVPNPGGTTRDV